MKAEPVVALKRYDAACRALATAKSTDEVKTIRNAAIAMKAYARQAKNHQLEKDAIAVRMRAERRVGELIGEQKKTEGLNRGGGVRRNGHRVSSKPSVRKNDQLTLAEAGIDKNLADRGRKLATMPTEKFEALVESVRTVEGTNVHFSSEKPEHYTPAEILEAVVACLGAIDLDPCSNSRERPNVTAAQHFTRADDGLSKDWCGRVFMNPPYGREIDEWIRKLVDEVTAGRVTAAIALLPGRIDTAWFRRLRDFLWCSIEGRLTFIGNKDPAPFPSIVVYLDGDGSGYGDFHRAFRNLGDIWQRIEPEMFGE